MPFTRFVEIFNLWALVLLVITLPLAIGSVHPLVCQLVPVLIFLMVSLTTIRAKLLRKQGRDLETSESSFGSFVTRYPFLAPFLLWLMMTAFQIVPLPMEWIEIFSKNTHALYSTVLGEELRNSMPISFSPFDSWRVWTHLVTALALFYLIVSYPSGAGKGGGDLLFDRLLLAILLTVSFEVVYGLYEYWQGGKSLLFFTRSFSSEGAYGTFINRNHFANYLILFSPVLFCRILSSQTSPQSARGNAKRVFVGVILLGAALAVALSHSRMAMMVGALISLTFLMASFFLSKLRAAVAVLFAGCLLIIAGLILWDPVFPALEGRVDFLLKGLETNRFTVWHDAMAAVKDFPVFGTGLGTYTFVFPIYALSPITRHYTHAHSDWLELLVETGILGSLLITAALFLFLVFYLKRLRGLDPDHRLLGLGILIGLGAFMGHSFVEFNFHIPANGYSFVILLGMGVRLIDSRRRQG